MSAERNIVEEIDNVLVKLVENLVSVGMAYRDSSEKNGFYFENIVEYVKRRNVLVESTRIRILSIVGSDGRKKKRRRTDVQKVEGCRNEKAGEKPPVPSVRPQSFENPL